MSFGQSKSSSSSTDETPREYRALRPYVRNTLMDLMGGGAEYQGPYAAPLSAQEQQILGGITGADRGPMAGLARGEMERTAQGGYLNPESNPFLASYIAAAQRPIMDAFNEGEIMQRAEFARAGHRIAESSPFARARAIATRGLADSLGDVSTKIAYGAYEGERGRQADAARGLSELDSRELNDQMQRLQAAALPRLITQLGYDKGLAEFQRRIQLALQAAGVAQGGSVILGNQSSMSRYDVDSGISFDVGMG